MSLTFPPRVYRDYSFHFLCPRENGSPIRRTRNAPVTICVFRKTTPDQGLDCGSARRWVPKSKVTRHAGFREKARGRGARSQPPGAVVIGNCIRSPKNFSRDRRPCSGSTVNDSRNNPPVHYHKPLDDYLYLRYWSVYWDGARFSGHIYNPYVGCRRATAFNTEMASFL